MAWKCPQCRQTNENALIKCTCGYAYYAVLGLKEDAHAQSVEQTYKYLIKVWKTLAEAHNAGSRGKLDERVNKINDAYAVFRQITKETNISEGSGNTVKIAVAAGAALIVIISAIFLFSSNQKSAQPTVLPVSPPDQMAVNEKSASAPPTQSVPVQPALQQPAAERRNDAPDMNTDKTPDWAIGSVKKSHILDRFSTVEVVTNKWATENSDKLKSIGWIARKVEESFYLVSFTATDGVSPTGFYFDINTDTGEIRNIANHPELQQKYGMKGN